MKTWARLFAVLIGVTALAGCATYYDDGYYDRGYAGDRYGDGGDYYVGRSYDRYDRYDPYFDGYYGYSYGPNSYYDSVLWPTRRYYDPWYSPYWYGSYPRSSFGFSLGYRDPFWYPSPFGYSYRHYRRDDRRHVDRGEWRPDRDENNYRRGDYRPGSAETETSRLANRRGLDRPSGGRSYSNPDRGYRSGYSMPAQPARGDWNRSRDGGGYEDRYESRRSQIAPSYQPQQQPQRMERVEPRAQPRFAPSEPPSFQRQEAPRFDRPARESFNRGRDRDDPDDPQ